MICICYNENMAEKQLSNQSAPLPSQNVDVEDERRNRQLAITITIAVIVFLGILGLAIYGLTRDSAVTENIRDIFIIFMALESLVIGAALVILIIQISSLINLLNNEIKPILDATNETIANLRGTTQFLSENLVEPVINLNSYLAGIQKMLELIGMKKK